MSLPFEGEKFDAVSSFSEMLRISYGDYMALPPPEKRIPHHAVFELRIDEYFSGKVRNTC